MWPEHGRKCLGEKGAGESGRGSGSGLGEQISSLVAQVRENEPYNELPMLRLLTNGHFYF